MRVEGGRSDADGFGFRLEAHGAPVGQMNACKLGLKSFALRDNSSVAGSLASIKSRLSILKE